MLPSSSSHLKELYNPKAFFTHAAWLDQGCPHCPIFPTAASRRSLGRVSVPVWLIILSDQLLDRRLGEPLPHQLANQTRANPIGDKSLDRRAYTVLAVRFQLLFRTTRVYSHVTHPCATPPRRDFVRLACVRPAASVRSEPGSNSNRNRAIGPAKRPLTGRSFSAR